MASWKCCSYNVCSFKRGGRKLLAAQATGYQIHLLGVQEARSSRSVVQESHGYIVASSGADSGQLGCELWINMSLQFARADARAIRVKIQNVTILHGDARRLLVAISTRFFSCLVCVLHAPHQVGVVAEWWTETIDLLRQYADSFPSLIVFTDANAQFSSEDLPSVGPIVFDGHKNLVGADSLSRLLKTFQMWAPGTFHEYCNVSDRHGLGTYMSKVRGCPYIIDYILCSNNIGVRDLSYHVWHSCVPPCKGLDHIPVCADLVCTSGSGSVPVFRRRLPYDRTKIQDPCCVQKFQALLLQSPNIPFDVDPTSHAYLLNKHVLSCACAAFPQAGPTKRKPYVSASTFECVVYAGKIRRTFLWANRRAKLASVFVVFKVWAGHLVAHWHAVYGFLRPCDFQTLALAYGMKGPLRDQIDGYIALERALWLSEMAERLDAAFCSGNVQMVYQHTKELKKSSQGSPKRVDRRVVSCDGVPPVGFVQERENLRAYFSELLGGVQVSFEALVEEIRGREANQFPHGVSPEDLYQALPSITALELLMSKSKLGKKWGEDLVCNDLLKCSPDIFAKLFHPVFVKSVISLSPPLQWRGGALVELYKHKGPVINASSYRDVMLADDVGKKFSKLIRHAFLPSISMQAQDTQFGSGLNSGDTSVAHLLARSYLDLGRKLGKTCALLFLDIQTAFASFVRSIVFRIEDGDEAWLRRLQDVGFSPSEIAEIYSQSQACLAAATPGNTCVA
eukprot:12426218-Karenia_brevis.AAC.1